MKALKKWSGLVLTLAVVAVGLGVFAWYTARPVNLNPAELTPAETVEPYPGCALSLEVAGRSIRQASFFNGSTQYFYHGDPPDYSGLEVLLEGKWYHVPHRDYVTAGVGQGTGPGECFLFEPILSPYGTLPDGQYRLSFGYWEDAPDSDEPLHERPFYVSYARFAVESGRYVTPDS